jgi:hypothetical protein
LSAAAGRYQAFAAARGDSPHADEAAYRRALCLYKAKQDQAAEAAYTAFLAERAKSPFADKVAVGATRIGERQFSSAPHARVVDHA